MKKATASSRITALVCLCLTLLILPLFLTSCEKEMLPKEQLLANTEALDPADTHRDYVGLYLDDLGYSGFDKLKFRRIELYFKSYYVQELPSVATLAKNTSLYFLENLYDDTDTSDKKLLTDALIKAYVSATGDKYAFYRNEVEYEDYESDMSGSFVGIGVTVQNPEGNIITVIGITPGSGAETAGIQVGDIICSVDGTSVDEVGFESLVNMIRGEIGTFVKVTVKRGEELLDFNVERKQLVEATVSYDIDEDLIAYVQITRFKANTAEQFGEVMAALTEAGAKGIIFDLRGNPGGYLDSVVDVLEYFVPKETRIVSYKFGTEDETVFYAEDDNVIHLPITVLCNEYTASAGELFTAALRDFREWGLVNVRIVGTTTYKKGVMQNTFTFQDNSALTMTVAYYNPPSNVNYDGVGVVPDVVVELPQEAQTDLQLEAAYEEIVRMIATSKH